MRQQLNKEIDVELKRVAMDIENAEADLARLRARKKLLTAAKTCEHSWVIYAAGSMMNIDICTKCGYQWHF